METLIQPCTQAQKQVIWKFFSDYKTELDKHFAYEEEEVIPYVKGLLRGKRMPGFSIDKFEENHSSINETLLDLKSLILKSLPPFCDDTLRVRLLNYLFALQKDLKCHTRIEDEVLVPMVRLIEDPSAKVIPESLETEKGNEDSDSNSADILSEREKEILVSVAQGLLNKEIADRHNISINTVITHRKNITRKTGIKTVAGLTVYAILNNLLDINDIPQQ